MATQRNVLPTFALTVCALAFDLPLARAQFNTGEIALAVTNPSGAVVRGAAIAARHPASGTSVSGTSDEGGRLYLPSLRIGVSIGARGFAPQTRRVVVGIGKVLDAPISLVVAGVSEAVNVELRRHCSRPTPPRSATSSRTARWCSCR